MRYWEEVKGDECGQYVAALPDRYCVVDIETTGFDPAFDEILEIGALRVENGEVTDRFSELVKPRRSIPYFISSLTGITNAMVRDARGIEEVLPRFLDFAGTDILLGHNTRFDAGFLYEKARRLGRSFPNPYMDTMRIARKLLKEEGLSSFKLADLAGWYGVSYRGAHRAVTDCEITLGCYRALVEDGFRRWCNDEDYLKHIGGTHLYGMPKAAEIEAAPGVGGALGPLSGKKIAFTGCLAGLSRREAMQRAADEGAVLKDSVSASLDYLVVGSFDSRSTRGSEKYEKAAAMLSAGKKKPQLLSEEAFRAMLCGVTEQETVR